LVALAVLVGPVTPFAVGPGALVALAVLVGPVTPFAFGAAESIGVGIAEALWLDRAVDVGLVDPLALAPAQPAAAMPMSSTTATSLVRTMVLRFTGWSPCPPIVG
jgi:hypothetical protein